MKNIINLIIISFLVGGGFVLSGCNNEPEISNISRITYFPTFSEGNSTTVVGCTSDYTVTPITATEGGNAIPVTVSTIGVNLDPVPGVNPTVADVYVETTSAVNADGYPGEVVRQFWVACTGDLVTSIEGLYTSTVARNSPTPRYFDLKYILIRKIGANLYEVSNADGGWYEFGRALGPGYRSPGATITAIDIPSNSFSFGPPVTVNTFGGDIVLTSMTVDPATKTIVFTSDWTLGYTFTATLTQVPL